MIIPADKIEIPILRLVGQEADQLGLECYVIGGWVRDIFLDRPSKDTDVVVIGAGVAGCAAARSAAENGAKVVLIEKADSPQGRGEDYAVINGDVQARYGRDNMDPDEIVDRLLDGPPDQRPKPPRPPRKKKR